MEDIKKLIGWLEIERIRANDNTEYLIGSNQSNEEIVNSLNRMKTLSEVISITKLLIP